MEPFYKDNFRTLYQKDSQDMSELDNESVDLLATDPPYGISFMGKDWDKALPDIRIWKECFRVLKPGAFAFVMSIPRADCLSRMIICLEIAGFQIDFSPIFWTYATGFPKAQNISKAVDKKLGAEREVVGYSRGRKTAIFEEWVGHEGGQSVGVNDEVTLSSSPQAKALDGSYGGFQPKPAVEVIIVAMKPLSEKTFVDQALKNRKGITWLDDCRIPYESEGDKSQATPQGRCTGQVYDSMLGRERKEFDRPEQRGRFPANLLVSDDVLNDGRVISGGKYRQSKRDTSRSWRRLEGREDELGAKEVTDSYGDSGSFSRYFDLDAWWAKTFPFLIVPKASKSEKEKLLDMPRIVKSGLPLRDGSGDYVENEGGDGSQSTRRTRAKNTHPTVKPVKLMAYLITLGSREGDIILDNFAGSGTTGVAAALMGRRCIMYEKGECETAASRCQQGALEF